MWNKKNHSSVCFDQRRQFSDVVVVTCSENITSSFERDKQGNSETKSTTDTKVTDGNVNVDVSEKGRKMLHCCLKDAHMRHYSMSLSLTENEIRLTFNRDPESFGGDFTSEASRTSVVSSITPLVDAINQDRSIRKRSLTMIVWNATIICEETDKKGKRKRVTLVIACLWCQFWCESRNQTGIRIIAHQETHSMRMKMSLHLKMEMISWVSVYNLDHRRHDTRTWVKTEGNKRHIRIKEESGKLEEAKWGGRDTKWTLNRSTSWSSSWQDQPWDENKEKLVLDQGKENGDQILLLSWIRTRNESQEQHAWETSFTSLSYVLGFLCLLVRTGKNNFYPLLLVTSMISFLPHAIIISTLLSIKTTTAKDFS